MVWGCGAGHNFKTIAGGTRHNASRIAAVEIDMLAPSAIPATMTRATAVNQSCINLDRVISVSMVCIPFIPRRRERCDARASRGGFFFFVPAVRNAGDLRYAGDRRRRGHEWTRPPDRR